MKKRFQLGCFFSLFTLLSGCNLDLSVDGEGRIESRDGEISCESNCRRTNRAAPKVVDLVAVADEGQTAIGLLNDNNNLFLGSDGYYYRTAYGATIGTPLTGLGQRGSGTAQQSSAAGEVNPQGFGTPIITPLHYSDSVTAIFRPTDEIAEIKRGRYASCVLFTDERIQCFGNNLEGEPESFSGITQFALDNDIACVIDGNGLRCWGADDNGIQSVPDSVENPIHVVLGGSAACVLHQVNASNEVQCWGDAPHPIAPPPLTNPRQLWTPYYGSGLFCTTDDNGDACWGWRYQGQSVVPNDVTNVSDFAVADVHTCAIASNQVRCWGLDSEATQVPSGISNPVSIATNNERTCVIDDSGLNCWGQDDAFSLPSNLQQPLSVSMSDENLCVDDDGAIKCSGDYTNGGTEYIYESLESYAAGRTGIACAIDNGQLNCFSDRGNTFRYFPEVINNPSFMSMGPAGLCYDSDEGVACYGYASFYLYDLSPIPELTLTPDLAVISGVHACFIENDETNNASEFQCWGRSVEDTWDYYNRGQIHPPSNVGVISKIESGIYHTCALVGSELNCWGEAIAPVPES